MPVFPAVPSTMVPPGRRVPRTIASLMMARAARSFTDCPGFRNSALPRISHPVASDAFRNRTSGVRPTFSEKSLANIHDGLRSRVGSEVLSCFTPRHQASRHGSSRRSRLAASQRSKSTSGALLISPRSVASIERDRCTTIARMSSCYSNNPWKPPAHPRLASPRNETMIRRMSRALDSVPLSAPDAQLEPCPFASYTAGDVFIWLEHVAPPGNCLHGPRLRITSCEGSGAEMLHQQDGITVRILRKYGHCVSAGKDRAHHGVKPRPVEASILQVMLFHPEILGASNVIALPHHNGASNGRTQAVLYGGSGLPTHSGQRAQADTRAQRCHFECAPAAEVTGDPTDHSQRSNSRTRPSGLTGTDESGSGFPLSSARATLWHAHRNIHHSW